MSEKEEVDLRKDFITKYYDLKEGAVNSEKRKKTKKLNSIRVFLLSTSYLLTIVSVIILASILIFSVSSLNNIEQMYAMINGDDNGLRSALETSSAFAASNFVEDFLLLYERKTEFILLLVVLPSVLILLLVILNAIFTRFVKAKTTV